MSLIETSPPVAARFARGGHIYIGRPPAPLSFPAEEEAPETNFNFERRVALYTSVKSEIARTSTTGSDQFVYWDPTSARKRHAPDLFVKLGVKHGKFDVWKVWERGAPELGVEIVSKSDRPEDNWEDKLGRYRAAGVLEVVRFDGEGTGEPIRVWDRVDRELVERAADDPERLACHTLGLWWVVVQAPEIGPMLRLARDRAGTDLLPTPAEARDREAAGRAREAEGRAREAEGRAREAEARVRAEQERDALRKELEALRAGANGHARAKPGTRRPRAKGK